MLASIAGSAGMAGEVVCAWGARQVPAKADTCLLYTSILTDEKQKEAELKLGNAVSLDQENTAEIEIPSGLVNESYLYEMCIRDSLLPALHLPENERTFHNNPVSGSPYLHVRCW